jgi:hypothetical protein
LAVMGLLTIKDHGSEKFNRRDPDIANRIAKKPATAFLERFAK